MGCFSYICKECDTPVNVGERCVIFFIIDGKLIEAQRGAYDNYGACEPEGYKKCHKNMESWRSMEWGEMVMYQFNDKAKDGFAVYHEKCYHGQKIESISQDDLEQGWGMARQKFLKKTKVSLCKFCNFPIKKDQVFCNKKCEDKAILNRL